MAEETGFRTKIIRAFGLEEDYNDLDDIEEDRYYSEDELSEYDDERLHPQDQMQSIPQQTQRANNLPDVLVLDPTSFDEAPGIVNKLKQDKTIVVNLKQTEFEEGRKIFDFLSGAVFALEGSLNRIAESVFILAPRLVSVATQMDDTPAEDDSYTSAEMLSYEEN